MMKLELYIKNILSLVPQGSLMQCKYLIELVEFMFVA